MFPHFDQSEYAIALKNAYRQFPAKDSTLDIDFINNRNRVAGVYGAALDGVTFTRSTTGTYADATGTMQTAAINEPRFEYDPVSLRPLGLLIEESRANLLTYSNDFTNAAWGSTGLTITPAGNGPDGTTTAYTVTATATNGELYRITTGTSGQPYAFSLWIRRLSGSGLIDLVVGDNVYQTITVTNRLTRVTIFNTPTTTTVRTYLRIRTAGDSISIANAQLEAGAFPTSYIPTTAASITRGADVASMTGAIFSSWYSQSSGSIFTSVAVKSIAGISLIARVDDNTENEIISVRCNTSNPELYIVDGGVDQAQIDAGTLTANTYTNLASAWQVNDAVISQNGQPAETDSSLTLPTPTQLRIGSDGTNYLNGWLSRLVYYQKRLPNNLLQYLSRLTA